MRLIHISKNDFDNIKDNFLQWVKIKIDNDLDTIFHFSSDLTKEDVKLIYENADHFYISKNRIVDIDNFEYVTDGTDGTDPNSTKNGSYWWKKPAINNDTTKKEDEDENAKFEIVMKIGKRHYNKIKNKSMNDSSVLAKLHVKIEELNYFMNCALFVHFVTFMVIMSK